MYYDCVPLLGSDSEGERQARVFACLGFLVAVDHISAARSMAVGESGPWTPGDGADVGVDEDVSGKGSVAWDAGDVDMGVVPGSRPEEPRQTASHAVDTALSRELWAFPCRAW